MCACDPGYTCSRCRDTSGDPRYHDELDPRDDDAGRGAYLEGASAHDPA